MDGQINFLKMVPIYHMSKNHVWEECPNCHAVNTLTSWHRPIYGVEEYGYWVKNDACGKCGQLLDWDDDKVEAATKYSKDYFKEEQK